MNDDFEFLEYIYQNAIAGEEMTSRIIQLRDKEDKINYILEEIIINYRKIYNAAKEMAKRRRILKELSIFSKMATYVSIKNDLKKNDTEKEVIEILTRNISFGIKDLENKKCEYKIKSKTIINLADRFIQLEIKNLELLKNIKSS